MNNGVLGLDEVGFVGVTSKMYSMFVVKGSTDALLLYMHYYWTALQQGTNQPWATDSYCMKGLGWGAQRFRKAKNFLIENGTIEIIQRKKETGRFGKSYVKLKMISHEKEPPLVSKPLSGSHDDRQETTNALSNKKNAEENKETVDSLFDVFYENYPVKQAHSYAKECWNRKVKTIGVAKQAIGSLELFKQTDQWAVKKMIPHPSTFINQRRWESEIEKKEGEKVGAFADL